jgi:transcriptional regulator with XRE-family HTH domain
MSFPHMNMAKAEPAPPPPDVVAGIGEEVRFLRSRGFVIYSSDVAGFWKVDGNLRSAAWIQEKAASVRARPGVNAPAPVVPTGEAPVAMVSTVKGWGGSRESIRGAANPNARPERFRGMDPDAVTETIVALAEVMGVRRFADAVAVQPSTISQIKTGRMKPTTGIIAALYGETGTTLLPQWVAVLDPEEGGEAAEEPTRVPDPDFVEHERAEAARVLLALDGKSPDFVIVEEIDAAEAAIEAAGAALRTETWRPDPVRPWSKLEDRDLVGILRGKLAGLKAEAAALDARRAELLAEVAKVQADSLDVEVRATALRVAIEAFTGDEEVTV